MGFGLVAATMISRETAFSKQLDDMNIVLKSSEEQSADCLSAKNISDIRYSELELQIIEQKVNYTWLSFDLSNREKTKPNLLQISDTLHYVLYC